MYRTERRQSKVPLLYYLPNTIWDGALLRKFDQGSPFTRSAMMNDTNWILPQSNFTLCFKDNCCLVLPPSCLKNEIGHNACL